MKKEKVIFHMDGDAFFVGVEVAKNPKLKGLPVVTGEERGIVSALSYEAKALGITRGMPIFRVKKDYPKAIIMPGDYHSYVKYSGMMFDIVRRYVDDVEEYSIDECFADLTGLDRLLKMSYKQIAERIKKEINDELHISVSIGIAPTKVLAKVASKWVKPNGLTIIEKDKIKSFLEKTPIEKIWGIGPRTASKLKIKAIETAKDFADKNLQWVKQNFSKPYETIWQELNGNLIMELDPKPKTIYSSIQKTRSFHPATNDKVFLLSQFSKNIEDACLKARHYKLFPKKLFIFLKTKGFKYVTSSILLPAPTNAPETLITLVEKEFHKMYVRNTLYRTTGVSLQELMTSKMMQTNLFSGSKADRFEIIHNQIDKLEDKHGKRMIYLASTHNAIKNKRKGTDSEDLDRNLLFL
jgi:nucleotidyltransferase/DNA polymerase involved in DNA repair